MSENLQFETSAGGYALIHSRILQDSAACVLYKAVKSCKKLKFIARCALLIKILSVKQDHSGLHFSKAVILSRNLQFSCAKIRANARAERLANSQLKLAVLLDDTAKAKLTPSQRLSEMRVFARRFFLFMTKINFMKQENTKTALLNAFDESEKKQVSEVCRIVGVTLSTYYFHFYKDADFRRQILEKQKQHLEQQIAAI